MGPQMGAANLLHRRPQTASKVATAWHFPSFFFPKNSPSHGTRPFIWLSLLLFLVGCFSVPLIGLVYFREPSRRCGHEPTNRSRLRETIVSGTAAIGWPALPAPSRPFLYSAKPQWMQEAQYGNRCRSLRYRPTERERCGSSIRTPPHFQFASAAHLPASNADA